MPAALVPMKLAAMTRARRHHAAVAVDDDAPAGVAGNDVALAGSCTADFCSLCTGVDNDTVAAVGNRGGTVKVRSDEVAVDFVVVRAAVEDFDAVAGCPDAHRRGHFPGRPSGRHRSCCC